MRQVIAPAVFRCEGAGAEKTGTFLSHAAHRQNHAAPCVNIPLWAAKQQEAAGE